MSRARPAAVNVTRLAVRVHPRAARERLVWDGRVLELWVSRPPVRGAANAAVIDTVAHWLNVPRGRIRIVSGRTSRSKLLDIESVAVLPPSGILLSEAEA